AIGRSRQVVIRLIASAGRIITRVIERDVNVTAGGIDGHPMIETIHWEAKLIRNVRRCRPGLSVVVREGNENVRDVRRRQVNPRAIDTTSMWTIRNIDAERRVNQRATK